MTAVSKVLVSDVGIAHPERDLVTVPAGQTWLIRYFSMFHNDGGSEQSQFGIKRAGAYYVLSNLFALAPGAVMEWAGRQVAEPGDQLFLYIGGGGFTAHTWASGTVFT